MISGEPNMLCENDNLAAEARFATSPDRGRGAAVAAMSRMSRQHIEVVMAEADADRQHHRTRVRARGDRRRSFWDDPDRFGLALTHAIRLQGETSRLRFGTGRSDWAAARHAAALWAPGRGQQVTYTFRSADGVVRARPSFAAGRDRHDTAARRLLSKFRRLDGMARHWWEWSGVMLAVLNSTSAKPSARRHAWAMLRRLGWRDLPREAWRRLDALLHDPTKSAA